MSFATTLSAPNRVILFERRKSDLFNQPPTPTILIILILDTPSFKTHTLRAIKIDYLCKTPLISSVKCNSLEMCSMLGAKSSNLDMLDSISCIIKLNRGYE